MVVTASSRLRGKVAIAENNIHNITRVRGPYLHVSPGLAGDFLRLSTKWLKTDDRADLLSRMKGRDFIEDWDQAAAGIRF